MNATTTTAPTEATIAPPITIPRATSEATSCLRRTTTRHVVHVQTANATPISSAAKSQITNRKSMASHTTGGTDASPPWLTRP